MKQKTDQTMKKKLARTLALVMSLLLVTAAFAACGGAGTTAGGATTAGAAATQAAATSAAAAADATTAAAAAAASGEKISLRVWAPQDEQTLLKEMCEAFAAAHPEASYQFDYGVVSEADARSRYSEDPEAAADVFMFPNDQLRELAQTSALYKVTRNKDDITARNMPGSIDAATYQDALYAYPMTADNGYFMYYDKSVFSEDDVKSLDQMLKVANEKGKKVYMDVSNGWYIASFFLGAGCNLTLDEAGLQVCDFNNADGLAAAEAIKAFTADPAFTTGDDTTLTGSIGGSLAAGVSGAWLSADVEAKLGENYAAVKLPTFTKGGAQVQMASFGGYKLIGVNSLTKSPVAAMDLADWLTNKENQLKRFAARSYGPSNTEASESPEVAENIALSALGAQNAFALPQNDVLGAYWNPAEAFGLAMEQKDYSKALQEMLDNMVAQITTV